MSHEYFGRISEGISHPSSFSLDLRMLKFKLPDPVDSYPYVIKQANPLEFYALVQSFDNFLQPGNILAENC